MIIHPNSLIYMELREVVRVHGGRKSPGFESKGKHPFTELTTAFKV